MFHKKRRWGLAEVPSTEDLATTLTQKTWTLCSAFFVKGHEQYLFLNDATHEDGAAEYAALKKLPDGRYFQVESITMSWCTEASAKAHIEKVLAGQCDEEDFVREVRPAIDPPSKHSRCHLCE